ncbi:TPA: TIGR00730 family Rossman fold protein [Candidatus Uhrbacteria bacterium]|nr:TIGR00730 family Rossman fold protein [Candidatus Uhrbacteria bacterium]
MIDETQPKGTEHKERKIPGTDEVPLPQVPDFREGASWKIFRIMAEFTEGFEFLADLKREVTFFGSARVTEGHPDYESARKLARLLGEAGFTIITGGGPGIMEAANRGAFEAGAESVGLNIQLPMEQRTNKYVKHGKGFYYFFTRKVMMSASSQAYLFFPGGFGTLDEMFELITLIQTGKMAPIPIVLIDRKYWEGLFSWIRQDLLSNEYIKEKDLDIVKIVDTAEEAFDLVKDSQERPYF